MKNSIFPITLTVHIYQIDNLYVAQCKELDLFTASQMEHTALDELKDVIQTHIEYAVKYNNTKYLFPTSLSSLEDVYYSSSTKHTPIKTYHFSINSIDNLTLNVV